MTKEEKARAYDEALRVIKECNPDENSFITIYPQEIFPELKESKDDKTRKELTEFLKSASGGFLDTTIQCKTFGKWLAWLEKQKYTQRDVDDAYLKGVTDAKNELEKQGEQKPEWSEENERMYRGLHNLIYSTPYCDSRKELSNFLDSLKNRLQSNLQQEWSEEDETGLTNTIIMLKEGASLHFNKKDITKAVDWLKSLRTK